MEPGGRSSGSSPRERVGALRQGGGLGDVEETGPAGSAGSFQEETSRQVRGLGDVGPWGPQVPCEIHLVVLGRRFHDLRCSESVLMSRRLYTSTHTHIHTHAATAASAVPGPQHSSQGSHQWPHPRWGGLGDPFPGPPILRSRQKDSAQPGDSMWTICTIEVHPLPPKLPSHVDHWVQGG